MKTPRAKYLLAAGGIVAALLAAVVVVVTRPEPPPPPPPPPPEASFSVLETRAVDPQDRPGSADVAAQETVAVVELVNSYYEAAFLHPKLWARGTHPQILAIFSAEAQASVTGSVQALALGDISPHISRAEPSRQEITKLSFVFEDDGTAPFAIATTVFEATATVKASARGPVKIVHNATWWMVKEAGGYRILAYSASLKADTVVRSAAFGVPPRRWEWTV